MKQINALLCLVALSVIIYMPALGYDDAQVLGQAETVLTAVSEPNACCTEASLGDLTADAVRHICKTDLAVVPGGAFAANLDAGPVTWSELCGIFPEEDTLATTSVTPEQLFAMLEQSVGHITLSESEYIDYKASKYDGFLQVSGIRFRYDVSSLPGERVTEVTLSDGRTLERTADEPALTIALPERLLEEYENLRMAERNETGLSIAEALADYIQMEGTVSAPEDRRMEAIGSNDNAIIRKFPLAALLIGVVLFAFAGLSKAGGRTLPRGMGEYDGIEL